MSPVMERAIRSVSIDVDEAIKRQNERIKQIRLILEMQECSEKQIARETIINSYKDIGILNDDGTPSSIYYGE